MEVMNDTTTVSVEEDDERQRIVSRESMLAGRDR